MHMKDLYFFPTSTEGKVTGKNFCYLLHSCPLKTPFSLKLSPSSACVGPYRTGRIAHNRGEWNNIYRCPSVIRAVHTCRKGGERCSSFSSVLLSNKKVRNLEWQNTKPPHPAKHLPIPVRASLLAGQCCTWRWGGWLQTLCKHYLNSSKCKIKEKML